ncbi:hypothetical protein LOZ20_000728 [Ophidiomyces ophidiicola]|nr:hypothetical protein LOZ59_001421 [Ophidiomyces ophidiicola]KAI2203575.1 hypothetical protein LOZ20_000728 [Ophidiomyces ophidiicola]
MKTFSRLPIFDTMKRVRRKGEKIQEEHQSANFRNPEPTSSEALWHAEFKTYGGRNTVIDIL